MIYVCRVDTGTRHIFDLADDGIENVGALANQIENQFKIEKPKQILLISGGEVLDDYQRKFYGFGFGCEESPIYLIDKTNVEKNHPPVVDLPLDQLCQDMKQDLQSAISLRPSFQTIQTRSQLIHRINELDKTIVKVCQSYYDDQYWQYQGYLTLIANLDEFLSSFRKKVNAIHEQFEFYLKNSSSYKDLMKEINKYIEVLSHVPLLGSLMKPEDADLTTSSQALKNRATNLFSCFSSQSIPSLQSVQSVKQARTGDINLNSPTGDLSSPNIEEVFESANNGKSATTSGCLTLLDWIKSTDPSNKLNAVIDETREILDKLENNLNWSELNEKIEKQMGTVESSSQMREIEGLTKRLDDLKGFLIEANKLLVNQNEINNGLQSNLQRAANLRDETIVQDLCKGHERQLEIFRANHLNLIEIASKISKAKLELIRVVHTRLYWIMQIQKKIADLDFQVQLYFMQLKRFNLRIRLMEQIKKAPTVYMEAIRETKRRWKFSNIYKMFGGLIIDVVRKIHEDEMKRRQEFDARNAGPNQHFILSILFRGLGDKVDLFVNETMFKFDEKLPQIEEQELKLIENELKKYLNDEPKLEDDQASDEKNLNTLSRLIDVLVNKPEVVSVQDSPQQSTPAENHRKTISPKTEFFKSDLSELKKKLEETKSSFINSKQDLDQLLTRFVKTEPERRSKLYSSIIECLKNKSPLNESTIDNVDREFMGQLEELLSKTKSEYEIQLGDLKGNIEQTKKTLGAEKQIQFNEAIKKLSAEKDRQIEELKLKQIEYLNRINALEKEINGREERTPAAAVNDSKPTTMISTLTTSTAIEEESGEAFGDTTKSQLRELMLKEKIRELERQLSMLNTLPLTNNFYETVQLNSCNVDDLVLAVYSEDHSCYKIIHKTSNYLHFVHSAVFKSFEHKLGNKVSFNLLAKTNHTSVQTPTTPTTLTTVNDVEKPSTLTSYDREPPPTQSNESIESNHTGAFSNDSSENISATNWFIGKVLVKEFCIAKKDKNRFKVPSGTRFYRVKLKPYLY